MDAARRTDPLRTLEVVVGLIVALLGLLTCAVLVGVAAGSGSIPGVNAEVCATTSPGEVRFQDSQDDARPRVGPMGLRDGVRWRADEIQICDPEPDGVTRALGAAGLTVWVLAPLLFFDLLWRLLRRARREGVFADRVPAGLRLLGGLLLVWATLDFVVTGFVNAALLNRMIDTDGFSIFSSGGFPWLLVLLGIAFLALERVVSQAVVMRHDVEATI